MGAKAILIFGLIGLGLLFVLTRRSGYSSGYSGEMELMPFRPFPKAEGTHHYSNEETWDITWSEDGLPTKVTIHRNAVQT